MSTSIYWGSNAAHHMLCEYSELYRTATSKAYSLINATVPKEISNLAFRVMYVALHAIPKLIFVAIPSLYWYLKQGEIPQVMIAATTWIFFDMLNVFYPWDVLKNINDLSGARARTKAVPNQPLLDKTAAFLQTGKSVLLYGLPGSGKTMTVRALGAALTRYPGLERKKIMELDLEELLSDHDKFLRNLNGVLAEATVDGELILFVDEVHRLMQTIHGVRIADVLKLYPVQMIGVTTKNSLDEIKTKDPAFLRRFHAVGMPSSEKKEYYAEVIRANFPDEILSDETVEYAIKVGEEQLPWIAVPDSAIHVLNAVRSWKASQKLEGVVTVAEINCANQADFIERFS